MTNNGTVDGYRRTTQVRGDGVYAFNPVDCEAREENSISRYGDNIVSFTQPFQADPVAGRSAALLLATSYARVFANVRAVEFVANQTDALMVAALSGDISSKVALVETVHGLTSTTGYYVHGVRFEISEMDIVTCTWRLAPAPIFWVLGVVGFSELGQTTYLGF